MKKVTLIAAAAALVLLAGCGEPNPAPQIAKTLSDKYPACVTETALDQLSSATVNSDNRMKQYLFKNQLCFWPKSGLEFSIVDQGFTVSKVRVWAGEQSFDVWVPVESTMK